MTTFGFSAYLKLISLNPRPQRREIRNRLTPSESGYDFHRSMRQLATRYALERGRLDPFVEQLRAIGPPAERAAATQAIARLHAWLEHNSGQCIRSNARIYESPRGIFRIRYQPDFRLLGSDHVDVHLWNTANPELSNRLALGALRMISVDTPFDGSADLSVLSLRNMTHLRASDAQGFELIGRRTVQAVEDMFIDIAEEIRAPIPEVRDAPRAGI